MNIVIFLLMSSCDLFGGGDDPGGDVVWSIKNQGILTVSTQPAIEGNRVYFIQDAQLKAYSLDKGEHIWSTYICDPGRTCDYSRKIVHSGDRIFIEQGYDIQAHRKATGELIWQTQITTNPDEVSGIGSPILSQDDAFLYAGRKGYVVKLRKSDGQEVMRYPLDRMVPDGVLQGSNEPVISPFGDDVLYVPTHFFDHSQSTPEEASGGNIFAFDATTGDLLWEHQVLVKVPNLYTPAPDDSLTGSPFIFDIDVTEDKVVALAGFYVLALNRETGEQVWETHFSDGGFDVGLTVTDNAVYAASIGRFATRVDLNTGKILWKRNITYSNTSIPTVLDGRMYFNNSGGGGIWVLDTQDGSVIYNGQPPNHSNDSFDVYISSLGVGGGYMVNVGSKAVYCLRAP